MIRRYSFLLLFLPFWSVAAPLDFSRDVKPIFEAHCLACHGPEKQSSEYRLDSRSAALAGGDSGKFAVVPGDPGASSLLRLVDGSDKELFMPPRKSDAQPLKAEQIAILRRWIAEGANWPESASPQPDSPSTASAARDHWSFQPLKSPPVPGSEAHPIDAFVRAKLRQNHLDFSPQADARTLCRRIYYDLTGLPPSSEELESYLRAAAQDPEAAWGALVDELLARSSYGERWARHWLDVVHYGETHGYDKDKPRLNAWPYRDYVIRAFNEDKPYARFIQEQVAGDVLFPDTVDGITALGFIAAGPWDLIGHAEVPESKIDGKIARHMDRDDMVSNTINTFQSVTVHCAQCHDHKFDPISQEDYYALQADFAALDRADKAYFPDAALTERYARLQYEKRKAESLLKTIENEAVKAGGTELAELDKQITAATKSLKGNTAPEFGYHSSIASAQDVEKWVQIDLGSRQAIDQVVLLPAYDDFAGIGAGFGFPVRFKIEVSDDPEFRANVTLLWRRHDETFMRDFPNPGITPFISQGAKGDFQGRYVRVTASKLAKRSNDYILALAELKVLDASGKNLSLGAKVTALDSIEAAPRWAKKNLVDEIIPVQPDPNTGDITALKKQRVELLSRSLAEPKRKERTELQVELERLDLELGKFPKPQMVYTGTVYFGQGNFIGTGPSGGKPRSITILARGDVNRPGKEVTPGTLTLFEDLPARFELPTDAGEGARRAALAHWLSSEKNPLTWRSIVNRVWQYHFGRGIVETPNDFGKMGTAPTHPELLDWLAAWFRDEAQGSFKQLHRLIVTSETYRQTSTPDASLREKASQLDGDNTWLWSQNRRRLEAEAIRDSILTAAGKLDLTMGGPSFQDFVINHPQHSPHYEYHLADPEDVKIHRRSIYRFIVRSQQNPWMATLDCADPSLLVDKRNETITPLQALAQLNNQLCVAMARHFAHRVSQSSSDPGTQIDDAFQIALQRSPRPEEREALVEHTQNHGLINTCRLILNLNEFVFVD